MQYHLRQVVLPVNAMTPIKPEVFIGMAAARFDAAGEVFAHSSTGRPPVGRTLLNLDQQRRVEVGVLEL